MSTGVHYSCEEVKTIATKQVLNLSMPEASRGLEVQSCFAVGCLRGWFCVGIFTNCFGCLSDSYYDRGNG